MTHAQAPQRFSRFPRAALLSAILFLSFSPSAFPQKQISPASRAAAVLDSMPHFERISEVALSPDGARLAYIANQKLIVAPVGGGPVQELVLNSNLLPRDVTWFPDSKLLAFSGRRRG